MKQRSIEDIIEDWMAEHGIVLYGKYRNFYRAIPYDRKSQLLMCLVQTMIDEGYNEEAIADPGTQLKVVEVCCPPEDSGAKKIEQKKNITKKQWKAAIKEFFRGKTSTVLNIAPREDAPIEGLPAESIIVKPAPKEEKLIDYSKIEVEPSDMIHPDRSGFAETIYDADFFADLGIDPPKEGSE